MDVKSLGKVEREVHQEAERLLGLGVRATEFSALVFGPDGLLQRLWKTGAERKAVLASGLYKWLKDAYAGLRDREAAQFEKDIASLS